MARRHPEDPPQGNYDDAPRPEYAAPLRAEHTQPSIEDHEAAAEKREIAREDRAWESENPHSGLAPTNFTQARVALEAAAHFADFDSLSKLEGGRKPEPHELYDSITEFLAEQNQ